MTNPLRTAVIGTGYLGRFHAQKYQQHADCNLIAACDQNLDRAQRVAAECHCEAITNHRDLFGKVDAVSIASTTSSHAEIASDCLKQGIHVLLEKPMTTTIEEADELIALAKEHNCVLQIGHLERYNNAMKAARPLLEEPRFIVCQRLAPFQIRCTDVSVVLDLMIHDIDLVLSIVKSPIADIQASGFQMLSDHVDVANARLTFKNGCVADLTASRVSEEPYRTMRVFQQTTYLDIDFKKKQLIKHQPDEHGMERHTQRLDPNDALAEEITDFCHHIRSNTTPDADGVAGREAMKVALSISNQIHAQHNAG